MWRTPFVEFDLVKTNFNRVRRLFSNQGRTPDSVITPSAVKKSSTLFFILCVVAITGCSGAVERTDLIGRYTSNYEDAVDTLELKEDGTYVHIHKSLEEGSKREFTNINKWKLELRDGKPKVIFSNFISGIPSRYSGEFSGPGTWVTEAKKPFFGRLRLPIFDDLNYYYEKEES